MYVAISLARSDRVLEVVYPGVGDFFFKAAAINLKGNQIGTTLRQSVD